MTRPLWSFLVIGILVVGPAAAEDMPRDTTEEEEAGTDESTGLAMACDPLPDDLTRRCKILLDGDMVCVGWAPADVEGQSNGGPQAPDAYANIPKGKAGATLPGFMVVSMEGNFAPGPATYYAGINLGTKRGC